MTIARPAENLLWIHTFFFAALHVTISPDAPSRNQFSKLACVGRGRRKLQHDTNQIQGRAQMP